MRRTKCLTASTMHHVITCLLSMTKSQVCHPCGAARAQSSSEQRSRAAGAQVGTIVVDRCVPCRGPAAGAVRFDHPGKLGIGEPSAATAVAALWLSGLHCRGHRGPVVSRATPKAQCQHRRLLLKPWHASRRIGIHAKATPDLCATRRFCKGSDGGEEEGGLGA